MTQDLAPVSRLRPSIFTSTVFVFFSWAILSLTPITVFSQQTAPKQSSKQQTPKPKSYDQEITPAVRDKVATQSTWSFLSLEAVGAESFLKQHPEADGRGTIVVIMDTGVDPGLPGLLTTSEDKRKIIDVQDFSGSGDIPYNEAQRVGDELKLNGRTVLHGLNALQTKPLDGTYYYAALNELHFQNGLGDLNFNSIDSDVFGLLLMQDGGSHFVAYIDDNADGSIADSKPVANYHEKFDIFSFHSGDTILTGNGRKLNGALNIFPEEKKVSVYFDDGSHGTHVAGIATGHDIDNQKGFNGLAPGAEVVGIKFADNTIGGVTVSGSMKRGFEYAARLARQGTKPVVVNVSFGIGSEIEGQSDMDLWLDSLLAATPQLTVCVSAGNDGPGLSTVGLPGSSSRVITSGAALPDDTGRDLFGADMDKPVLWDFSSRGGELAKPDIVTPGTAVSTVPDYVSGDRYNGTSMSSPYTAGCCAVILSAMKQTFPGYKANAYQLKRALQLSATPISGLTPLDQGFGMINIPNAFDLLSKWYRQGGSTVAYSVQVDEPGNTRHGTAAFFRNGIYPKNGESIGFTFKESGTEYASERDRAIGMRSFDLVSDADWLLPVESSTYHRGEGAMSVHARYNDKLLQTPGLYTGRIWVFPKTGSKTHLRSESLVELLNTIIVPHRFSVENNFTSSVTNIKPSGAAVRREFFAIPAGAKAVRVTLSGKSSANARLYDNEGKEFGSVSLGKSAIGMKSSSTTITGDVLTSGVWEVDIVGGNTKVSQDDANITLDIQVLPFDVSVDYLQAQPKASAIGRLSITNLSSLELSTKADAEILGYERVLDTTIRRSDELRVPFHQIGDESAVEFDADIPKEDYNHFTDIAFQALREDSVSVLNNAFDYHEKAGKITFDEGDHSNYTLLIKGGLALNDRLKDFRVLLRERRMISSIGATLDSPHHVYFPDQTEPYDLSSTRDLPDLPAGYNFYGNILLHPQTDVTVKIPVTFRTKR